MPHNHAETSAGNYVVIVASADAGMNIPVTKMTCAPFPGECCFNYIKHRYVQDPGIITGLPGNILIIFPGYNNSFCLRGPPALLFLS